MHLLLSTIALRPYVFIFLASFLLIAIVNFGLRTTLLFTVLTYAVSLACEWSSVHNGFPFGLYHYIEATRGRELWVFGVPFMDSLSFTFLAFASYTRRAAAQLAAVSARRGFSDSRHLANPPRTAGVADGRVVHGDGGHGRRSFERARRADGSSAKFSGTTRPDRILACRSATTSVGISSPRSRLRSSNGSTPPSIAARPSPPACALRCDRARCSVPRSMQASCSSASRCCSESTRRTSAGPRSSSTCRSVCSRFIF